MPSDWAGLWRRAFASEAEEEASDPFCVRVVRAGRVTPEQLQECLRELERLRRNGSTHRIEHLLLVKGYLRAQDLTELLGDEAATPAELPETGIPLGKYTLHRPIGRGGMGVVYEADDPQLRRRVAVKVVREDQAGPEGVARLHREGAVMAQLRHPNIVAVHEVGVVPDASGQTVHYIAMEYVPGRTLAEVLADRTVKRADRLRMLEEVARAVAYAHTMGILHRDLKPGNVLVESNGRVLLTDFGLARAATFSTRLTRSVDVLGTPVYMAPEQVMGKTREIDERTDVYALGVMLYEILVGHPPFRGETPEKLYLEIVSTEPPAPTRVGHDVERDVEVVCLKAMERDRGRRYRTALAFAEDLGRFRRGEPIEARPAGRVYRLRRWILRRWIPVAAAAVLVSASMAVYGIVSKVQTRNKAKADALTAAMREVGKVRHALDEADTELYLENVDYAERLRNVEKARTDLERIAAAWPDLEGIDHLMGRAWETLGWTDRAEASYRRAIERDPQFAPAHFRVGRLLMQRADVLRLRKMDDSIRSHVTRLTKEAAVEFEAACAGRWPGHDHEIFRALSAMMSASVRGDIDQYRSLAKENAARFTKGRGAEELYRLDSFYEKDPARKLEALNQALRLCPGSYLAHFHRAHLYGQLGRKEEELADLTAAIGINPRFASAYYNRGTLHFEDGNIEEAIQNFTKTLGLAPDHAEAYCNRGAAYAKLEQFEDAFSDFARALELRPNYPLVYFNRGKARKSRGEIKEALADYTEALRLDPTRFDALVNRANLYLAEGRLVEALADYTRAVELRPDREDLRRTAEKLRKDLSKNP